MTIKWVHTKSIQIHIPANGFNGYLYSSMHSGAGSSEVWAVGGAAAALNASFTCWRVL